MSMALGRRRAFATAGCRAEGSTIEPETLLPVENHLEFDRWLEDHWSNQREVWVVIFKQASKKQSVTFDQLLESAIRGGWSDVKIRRVDDERYAIRFVPRRSRSNWTETNRGRARRLIAAGRMCPEGLEKLPEDL